MGMVAFSHTYMFEPRKKKHTSKSENQLMRQTRETILFNNQLITCYAKQKKNNFEYSSLKLQFANRNDKVKMHLLTEGNINMSKNGVNLSRKNKDK